MFKEKFILVLLLLFFSLSFISYSQTEEEFEEGEEIEEKEQEKDIDPEIRMWYLNGYGAFIDSTIHDTLQQNFHLYHPVYKNAITVTNVGNYGSPYINNDFFRRESSVDFFFLKSREAYLLNPSGIKYYNTRTPYTIFDYSQSENKNSKNETRFNVLHTQNVNPFLNFTFRYDLAKSQGQYTAQEGKNNFVTIYSSYNKGKLQIHSGFISNTIKNDENGGLTDDNLIFSGEETEYLNVNLNNSKSSFSSTYFYANGEYRLGKYIKTEEDEPDVFKPIAGILYSFEYQRHKQEFIDEEDTLNLFFPITYYGNDFLRDSVRFNKISNVVQLKQYENPDKKASFGKRAFLGQEFIKVSSPGPIAENVNRETRKFTNVYAGGGIFRETGNFWTWNFDGKFYFLGRNIGQTVLNGIIKKPLSVLGDSLASFTVNGSIENLVADYFQEEFYSNHVRWKNDFKMEQRMLVKGSFKSPKNKFEIGSNYAIINNLIYNDTLAIPTQTNKEILVLSAFINKDFSYNNLYFKTKVLWQKSSNQEFIHLPDLSAFVSAYYKFVISKVLFTQIGVDARYNTSYYADAYAPSTGLFYIQNEKKVGDFPYIDVHASLRLKRTRLFFKMMNIGTQFIDREYFTTPHYPMNRSTFRFGAAWVFYD